MAVFNVILDSGASVRFTQNTPNKDKECAKRLLKMMKEDTEESAPRKIPCDEGFIIVRGASIDAFVVDATPQEE